jgi:hypothetical protein
VLEIAAPARDDDGINWTMAASAASLLLLVSAAVVAAAVRRSRRLAGAEGFDDEEI